MAAVASRSFWQLATQLIREWVVGNLYAVLVACGAAAGVDTRQVCSRCSDG